MLSDPKQLLIIDVREKWEVEEHGYIDGAKNIPLGEIEAALALPSVDFEKKYGFDKHDFGRTVVCYCRSGARSQEACKRLIRIGVNSVNYAGSFIDWFGKTYPMKNQPRK